MTSEPDYDTTSVGAEVLAAGDAENGVVTPFAFQAAVAEDLTRKWLREGRVDRPGRRAGVREIRQV